MVGIQKIPVVSRNLTICLNIVFQLKLQDGFFCIRTEITGNTIVVVPKVSQLPLYAFNVGTVIVQLDPVFLRIVGKEHFLQRGGSDTVLFGIGCALKQRYRISCRFIVKRSWLVGFHIAEIHELLLQRGDIGVIVV